MTARVSPDRHIAAYAVALGTPVLAQTTLTVKDYGGDFAALAYATLPANQPNAYGSCVYLWNSTAIPFGSKPPPPHSGYMKVPRKFRCALRAGLTYRIHAGALVPPCSAAHRWSTRWM